MHPSEKKEKKLSLHPKHLDLGAKMTPFAGYLMPIFYESIKEEHLCVRQNVGVFDVSHMGQFMISGAQSLPFIQSLLTNDAAKLTNGQAQYTCMTNPKGGIIDDLLLYRFTEEKYMVVVNASNMQKDWDWFQENNHFDIEMNNISDQIVLLAVQGPKAIATLQKLTSVDLNQIKYYHFKEGILADKEMIISKTGYTGEKGFELYMDYNEASTVWEAILQAGKDENIKPIGLGARDTLRLEMGFCLYGNDLSEDTSPLQAGLGWITKWNKKFTASEILQKEKEKGIPKKLIGFVMQEKALPRQHYDIYSEDDKKIGWVTSGSLSPCLEKGIGMGYVSTEYAQRSTPIQIQIRNKRHKAEITVPPFITK